MLTQARTLSRSTALCGVIACVPFLPLRAHAEGDSATVRLIQLLIQKHILTSGQAASLLDQARSEAGGPTAAGRHAGARAPAAIPGRTVTASSGEASSATGGEIRVTYVPQFVRDQIAAQVRGQVLQEVQDQGWAKPDQVPDWIHRLTLYGDFRLRYQADLQDKGNRDAATGLPYPFPNFNAIDGNGGFDTSGAGLPPLLNVTENRSQYEIRARVGVHAQIADWITSDVRIATGNTPSPISENQTLGQPGYFQNYAVYVDLAYVKMQPERNISIYLGRAPDPYFVTDLMFYRFLNLDGASVQYTPRITDALNLFFTGGAYPVFNTSLNFSTDSLTKESSHDAYLLAAQGGGSLRLAKNYVATFGAGYFNYSNITGKESAPCLLLNTSDTCSTDDTVPSFQTFGNTVFPVRDIITNSSSLPETPELYGLSSHFGIVDLHGRLDIHVYDPIVIALEGEYLKNLAFNRSYVLARQPANNIGSNNEYQGGDTGYLARITVGYPDVEHLWDWKLTATYKYLESDAVLDSITDPDFHLGGTNAKGYILDGELGVADNTNIVIRWLSADVVSGPPDSNDVLQVDLNTKF